MNCLIHLFALCVFDPSNVTLHADVSWQAAGRFNYWTATHDYGGATIGSITLSVDMPITKTFVMNYGYEHRSLLDTRHDRGEERIQLGFTWKPFR